MGSKLSKLYKHTYVVSESIQTDLSIQSCDEATDLKSYITPPRDVHQHLSDPRSITRGIIRTPIMCKLHEKICASEDVLVKPYLETNMDEVLFIDPPESYDHVIEVGEPCCSYLSSSDKMIHQQLETELKCPAPPSTPNNLDSSLCQIQIPDNCELSFDNSCFGNPSLSAESFEKQYRINISNSNIDSTIDADIEDVCQTSNEEEDIPVSQLIHIDSSETVQQVCQKIVKELLNESEKIYKNETNEFNKKEVFVDGNMSDIVESMNKLCVNGIDSPCEQLNKENDIVPCCENIYSPTSSKFTLTPFKTEKIIKNSNRTRNKSPMKINRQPLQEVNKNIQPPRTSLTKTSGDIENSPRQSVFSLLPAKVPQSTQVPKSHRSNWDTEKTVII